MAVGPPAAVAVSTSNFLRYVDLIVMDSAAISAAHPERIVLGSVILDNRSVVLALDLEELRISACSSVGAAVHILYTVDHSHLRSFGLAISNNNGGVHPPPALLSVSRSVPPARRWTGRTKSITSRPSCRTLRRE